MKRPLQVFMEDRELQALDAWASERGWTKSQAVRAAIRALTRCGTPDADPLLALSGMVVDGLPPDTSERFDHYLLETFVAERPGPYRRAAESTVPRRRRR